MLDYCRNLQRQLAEQPFNDGKVIATIDDRDLRGGEKTWHHVKRGVPLRIEVGPRDIQGDKVCLYRRDLPPQEKSFPPRAEFVAGVSKLLDDIQSNLYQRALKLREDNTRKIDAWPEFQAWFTPQSADKPEIHAGFAMCHFADDPAVTAALNELKVTVRCIPQTGDPEPGKCLITGQPTPRRVVLAKAY